ncbi:DEAD-domain-containing protein [Stereum hirsutum FP-91666 SS1]|uniref:DEAD-domain-containing protein n=1 Tax=Stereum hirsutum (strain FP-91666) TaxID=721885 RepID=UPI000440D07C|nr:DEAD-domain-containing protein [Stereum hirsutum FP-91666 SS1]EIM88369.1 DEAD-domain-containing protein [Stereum hirsutum FP-91666 SS1]
MSTGSFGDGEDYEDEIEVQSGRPSRGKEDGPGHSEDEEEEESSEDGESDEEAASSHAPWKSLDAESTLTSRIALKPKSSTSRLPDQQNLKTSPQKNATFASLDISPPLISALSKLAIRAPTEIQLACIPPLLAGEDCIGNAKTGSGKTIAFALPILQKLSMDPYGIYALVLTPTRELAFQISEQFAVLGAHLNIRTAVIVGGMDMMTQALELGRRPHVVIATPGRLVDHLRSSSGEWDLSRVKFLVLDEADRLLTSTFSPELAHLFGVLPRDRQTALFTATWTPSIDAIADATPRPGKQKPFIHKITAGTETVETLQQFYMLVPSQVKESYLYHLLCNPPESTIRLRRAPPESTKPSRTGKSKPKAKSKPKSKSKPGEAEEQEQPPPTMIFCARTRTAAYLTNLLKTLNIRTTALHSRLTQRERLNSLQLFKSCVVPVMVCTDVGARGLDIEDVAMVVNWDLPEEPEEYTHRVGRTARAGRDGVSVSFVGARDEERVHKIENRIKTKLSEMDLPESKVLEKLNAVSTAKRLANMELHDSRFGKREEIQKRKRET